MLVSTDDEITEYLSKIKELIIKNNNNLIISTNRDINLSFMKKYGLTKKNIIDIINSLNEVNFEEKVINEHQDYPNENLYIFSKNIELVDDKGNIKDVMLYIKFNLLNKKVILISFHEAKYKFKGKY